MLILFAQHGTPWIFIVLIGAFYVLAMVWFVDRKLYEAHKWRHHNFSILLIFFCIMALLFQPLVVKMYAVLMLIAAATVEITIRRKRKRDQPLQQHNN